MYSFSESRLFYIYHEDKPAGFGMRSCYLLQIFHMRCLFDRVTTVAVLREFQ